MLTEAVLEKPSTLRSAFVGVFSELERFFKVNEPVRILPPIARVVCDGDRRGRPEAAVFPLSNGRFIFADIGGYDSQFWEASYLRNPSPEVNPDPPVRGNRVFYSVFVRENKAEPGAYNVLEEEPVSPALRNLVQRAMGTRSSDWHTLEAVDLA